jgi:hypothetical protein
MRLWLLGVLLIGACESSAPPAPVGDALPGAPPAPIEVVRRLRAAWDARPRGYTPRTRHLRADGGPRYTNRLFLESSPYLLQHAHNPVDWYPWGDEAFATARRLGRPVLLSVGYATCHWCHVMEEESFEDEEIARFLNEHYVAIKVDREERPDVDAIYMSAVQALTGGGGWPMNVWLTPERQPFYGGTYFPARDGDRGVGVGFLTILRKLRTTYDDEPARVVEAAASLASTCARAWPSTMLRSRSARRRCAWRPRASATASTPPTGARAGRPSSRATCPCASSSAGSGGPATPRSLRMATLTLAQMAAGGIRDHVGGGFHRYSTDARWLVPHFEKMLYDNALLALAYLEGWQATGRSDFATVAREILRWVERDMTPRTARSTPRPMRTARRLTGPARRAGSSPGRRPSSRRCSVPRTRATSRPTMGDAGGELRGPEHPPHAAAARRRRAGPRPDARRGDGHARRGRGSGSGPHVPGGLRPSATTRSWRRGMG